MDLQSGDSLELFTERGKQPARCAQRTGAVAVIDLPMHFAEHRGIDLTAGRILALRAADTYGLAVIIRYQTEQEGLAKLFLRLVAVPDEPAHRHNQPFRAEALSADGDQQMGEYRTDIERVIVDAVGGMLAVETALSGPELSERLGKAGIQLQPFDIDHVLTRNSGRFQVNYKGEWHLAG